MADRVAIIGGNSVGRDHFPWPIADDDFVNHAERGGADVPLVTAAKWFWRVKTWRVSAYCELSQGGGAENQILDITNDFDLADATFPFDPGTSALDREAKLVRNRTFIFETFASEDQILEFSMNPIFMMKDPDGPFFYFPIRVRAADGNAEMDVQNFRDGEQSYYPDHNLDDATMLDDVSRPAYFYLGSGTRELVSATINIQPIEYWPYATKAGLPVYDTSTGAQLRDPLS